MSSKEYRFKARLQAGDGGGAFVEFPLDVKKEFGKGRVPFKATIDGEPYSGTMVKYGSPRHMILVLKAIREKIKKNAGDEVEIWLVEDNEQRTIEVPADLRKVLKREKLEKLFDKLSYTHKREYITWICDAKKEETRLNRIEKTATKLLGKK